MEKVGREREKEKVSREGRESGYIEKEKRESG